MKMRWTPLILAALLATSACDDATSPTPGHGSATLPRPLTDAETQVANGVNEFGFSLLSEVLEDDERPNIVLSPLSASMALGMTMAGAKDSTFKAMRSTLKLDGLNQAQTNQAYRGLVDLFQDLDSSVSFNLANAIWANEQFTFHQSFFDDVQQHFDAKVTTADFSHPNTVRDVNNWVSEKTTGKIKRIVNGFSPNDVMVLLNAIDFEAEWRDRFDPDDTRTRDFHRPDGSTVPVQMMERTDAPILYVSGEDYSLVELLYGAGGFSMVLAIPWDGDARALAQSFDAGTWSTMLAGADSTVVDLLAVPKLKLTYDALLNDVLDALGMGVAFGAGADFTGMSPDGDRFCISTVRQKTFMEVDETGTKAAAVTAVGVRATSFFEVAADRPFVFAIRERTSGTLLFVGVIEDPTAEAEDPMPVTQRCG